MSSVLFLHFPLQKRRTLPSRLTKFIPVPGAISLPQKLHLCTWGNGFTYLIFLASRSVSRRSSMSSMRTGPFTFRVMIRPLSLPSSILTLTCMISPVSPVLPMIWMTVAGVRRSESWLILLHEFLDFLYYLGDQVLGVPRVLDGGCG